MSEIYTAPDMTSEAFISALEEVASIGEPDFRANVPEGTQIGEVEIEGSQGGAVRFNKPSTMMKVNGRKAPERVMLWNKQTGRGSMVPTTIATKRIMQGTDTFPASAFTLRNPGAAPRQPIAEHCWVCDKRRAEAGNPPRDFFDVIQYEAHMDLMHPREWASFQRRGLQQERLDERQAMRDMIMEVVKLTRPDLATAADEDAVTEAVLDEVAGKKGK